ncbi:hypothetical protein BASA83_008343 [Batrachochytrium salamandrivorans]|nr:hypothetical protein BASA83_008343 [Batrachochytrium salamandrivorans]
MGKVSTKTMATRATISKLRSNRISKTSTILKRSSGSSQKPAAASKGSRAGIMLPKPLIPTTSTLKKKSQKPSLLSKLMEQKKAWGKGSRNSTQGQRPLSDWEELRIALSGNTDVGTVESASIDPHIAPTMDDEVAVSTAMDRLVGTSGTLMAAPLKPISQSARRKQNTQDIGHFRKILSHPQFRANPVTAIQTHLKNTL